MWHHRSFALGQASWKGTRWTCGRVRTRCFVMALALALASRGARGSEVEATPLTDQTVARELRPGETHSYVVSAEPDEWLKIVVTHVDVDVAVAIADPAGQTMVTYDEEDAKGGAVEEVGVVTEVGGEHRIAVRAIHPQFGGRYEVRLVERRPALPRDRRFFAAEKALARADETYPWRDSAALRAAAAFYESALEGWRALGVREREATTLNSVAVVHAQLGERQKGLEEAHSALAIFRELGDLDRQSSTALNIASFYGDFGEPRRAVDELLPLLDTLRQKDMREGVCVIENNLASFLGELGESRQALLHCRAALEACRPLAPAYLAGALLKLAGEFGKVGLEERALEAYAEALSTARQAGMAKVASLALTRTGGILLRQGETRKAAETLKEALPFAESSGDPRATAEVLTQVGRALTELGETASADERLEQAIRISERIEDHRRLSEALVWRGNLHAATGQLEDAGQDYERALSESRSYLFPHNEASALYGLARVAAASGRLDEVLRRSEEAIGVAESLRAKVLSPQNRAEYLASVRPYYDLAVDVLMSLHVAHADAGYDLRALQTSDRGRARMLLDGLTSATEQGTDRPDSDLARKERELRERLNGQAARLFRLQERKEAKDDVAAVRKQVEALLDQLQELQGRPSDTVSAGATTAAAGLALPDLQQRVLDERSLLLVYALGERRSFVWAASRGSIVSRELPPRAVVEAEAWRYRDALSARGRHPRFETPDRRQRRLAQADGDAADAGHKLSEMLLRPVATELGRRRLLVVADDSLNQVPFASLPEPEAVHPAGKSVAGPLLVNHDVLRVPSVAALRHWCLEELPHASATKTLAVFADPVFDRYDPRVNARVLAPAQGLEGDWREELTRSLEQAGLSIGGRIPRLPHTREEASALTALVPREQRYVALGFEANRKTALSPDLASYRFLHFATHAVVDQARPELSSVVLSLIDRDGREQDGFLRAQDASQWQLNADLVTLSGCGTGLGRQVRGEGTLGLAHSFLRAGARRVLVSLWDVDDRATAAFMAQLYRAMLGPTHLSPAAALRRAQMTMRGSGRWSAPYYWAGFVLTGDPSGVPVSAGLSLPHRASPAPSGAPHDSADRGSLAPGRESARESRLSH